MDDAERRERWCGTRMKRAEDITPWNVIKWHGRWTEVFGVYRSMDEWEAEFGTAGGITGPEILPGQPNPEYEQARADLDWAAPTWVLLRLFDLVNANEAESPDFVIRVYKFDLIEVQDLPAYLPAYTSEEN